MPRVQDLREVQRPTIKEYSLREALTLRQSLKYLLLVYIEMQ